MEAVSGLILFCPFMLNIEYLINIGQRLKWLAKFKAIYQLLGYRLNLMFTNYLGPTFFGAEFLFFGIMTNKLSSHTFTILPSLYPLIQSILVGGMRNDPINVYIMCV